MLLDKVKQFLIGNPLTIDKLEEEQIPKWKALAVLSSDALSSVAYATEEVLIPLSIFAIAAVAWSIPMAIGVAVLLLIITLSYQQTISAYPHGGGAYTVAKENLGENAGLVAGAALLIDYILTVSVSVSAGVANIGSAFPRKEEAYMEVTGRNLISGLPKTITISSNETIEAMQEPLNRIMETLHGVLERTPPELTSDIAENGICMTGGGSLLYGLDRLLTERTKIPCYVAEDAISCVAIGTGKALESLDVYSERAVYDYRRGDYYNSGF